VTPSSSITSLALLALATTVAPEQLAMGPSMSDAGYLWARYAEAHFGPITRPTPRANALFRAWMNGDADEQAETLRLLRTALREHPLSDRPRL
jgi:hypothetical protein